MDSFQKGNEMFGEEYAMECVDIELEFGTPETYILLLINATLIQQKQKEKPLPGGEGQEQAPFRTNELKEPA